MRLTDLRIFGFAATMLVAATLAVPSFAAPGVAGAASAVPDSPGGAPVVLAQDGGGWHPLSPLLRLFRGGRRAAPPRKLQEPEKPQRTIRRVAPAPPKIQAEPKSADARTVLVVGDAMADGLARGLEAAYAQTPTIKVESEISRSLGLIRKADPDWPTRIAQRLKQGDVNVVVVMLGTDDRRQVTLDGQRAGFRDPAWEEVYRVLVQRTVAAVRDSRKPLVWVGLPPVSGPDRRSDFSYLNDFYKEKVETADGIFVDLWEAFLSEEGKYTSYGADVDGKRQRLRTEDGLYFTWPGYRKVAFFVQQRIARILGEGPALELAFPGGDANMILLSGGASREETLAGEEIAPAIPSEGSLQHRLIVEGRPLPQVEGRVDDYRITR
ncbi:GDSL-type esterase/lipase family protein [Breoghania sp. JC706]|uniref:SGNH/GDSL hydrolase family protein n=1 Tax=Breoghania sp. JC706 TaxID=3117732 RepID=UPI0030094DC2